VTWAQTANECGEKIASSPFPIDEILVDDSIGIVAMINCRNAAEAQGHGNRVVALMRSDFTKESMDLLRRNGYSRYRVKPLRPWELISTPNVQALQRAESPQHDLETRLRALDLRMLVVDDSNDNLFLLREVVRPVAKEVHFATDGLEALEKFKQCDYDVIFMDIQMPVMDGYTAIAKIRRLSSAEKRNIPVFAITAHGGLVDAQRCQDAGFTGRVVKPVSRIAIYSALAEAFDGSSVTQAKADDDPSGLSSQIMDKLIPVFIKARTDDLRDMRTAIGNKDFQALARLGHKVKGSAASFGFEEVSQAGIELEHAANGQDLDLCQALVGKIDHLMRLQTRP
jgi:CheY-like chemotaxis protein